MSEQLCRARIAQNAQTREPTLDLSSLRLTSLPETIGKLTHLEALDLSWNRLRQLPPELAKLTKLRKLDLSYNDEIGRLEPWIGDLVNLEELSIRELSVTELPANLAQFHQLHTLDISYIELSELPHWLGDLPKLQVLDINGLTNLSEIPQWFTSLQLKRLTYDLKNIPNEHLIGTMTSLEALDLGYANTYFDPFPEWLRQMHHLRWLRYNSQTLVPPWLIELSQLSYLESNADFSEISQVWHSWESLEQLKCQNIGDTTLPPNLKTLDLRINQATFPESIRVLDKLEELHVEGKGFRELPGWVLALPSLHTLDLISTEIDRILPPDKANDSLRKLQMYTSCSRELSLDGLRSLRRLEELSLTEYRLRHLPAWMHELQQLRKLSIDACALTDLDPRLGQLQQLEWVCLVDNKIPVASLERILPQLTQLQHLSFDVVNDDPFPTGIRQLYQLRSLSLRIRPQHIVPEWLNQFTHLESLMIGDNIQPHQIPWIEGLLTLPKLRQIHIRSNLELFDPELLQRFTQRGVKVDLG